MGAQQEPWPAAGVSSASPSSFGSPLACCHGGRQRPYLQLPVALIRAKAGSLQAGGALYAQGPVPSLPAWQGGRWMGASLCSLVLGAQ